MILDFLECSRALFANADLWRNGVDDSCGLFLSLASLQPSLISSWAKRRQLATWTAVFQCSGQAVGLDK